MPKTKPTPSFPDLGGLSTDKIIGLLGTIFSTVVLTAIGVALAGKLMARRVPFGLDNWDEFHVPLIILRVRARGDELAWGFILFIFSATVVISLGGKPAYIFFKDHTGVDVGQWNSLCAITSSLCLLVSFLMWIIVPLFRGSPILTPSEREELLDDIEARSSGVDKRS